MIYKKVKFKNSILRKKLPIITDDYDDYVYFIDKLNFDPVYFITGKDGLSMKDLDIKKDKTIEYISETENICFLIESTNIRDIK